MVQVAHIAVLIAALLACPVNCWGTLEGEGAPASASPGCSCCHTPVAGPSAPRAPEECAPEECAPEKPGAPQGDDCRCGNCLCHGAVLSDQDCLGLDGPADAVYFPPSLAPTSEPDGIPNLLAYVDRADSLFPSATGRSVRILHQSFLN